MKLVLVASTLLFFSVCMAAVRVVTRSQVTTRRRLIGVTRVCTNVLLRILNIRCTVENPDGLKFTGKDRYLVLPNHMSYLDVLIVNAMIPSIFVTSREIEETPVLGHVTRVSGCAFVERRHIWQVQRDIDQLSALLNDGYNVTLFPEGSTSAGDRLLDFKKTLLESAVRSRSRILPVCLRYERIDGRRFDQSNRDLVAWYGDMRFFPHLWKLMSTRSIDARLTLLGEVACREHKSRKRIASDVKARIAARFHAD